MTSFVCGYHSFEKGMKKQQMTGHMLRHAAVACLLFKGHELVG
jgi:hypothetical protein